MTSAVHIDSLTRRFGDVLAVDDLSLDIRLGEVFGLLGHNGAGKTTTIRILNGILEPSAGVVSVMGLDPGIQGVELRRRTGVLTETPALDDRLSGRENLEIFADLYDVPSGRVRSVVDELLETFQLAERADHRVHTYSKGMKQRLALARTLINNPELLYLDEPTSGLDPVAAYEVREMIRRWGQATDRTVFLCTHNLVEAQELCDRVGVLERGRLRLIGTPEELIDSGDSGVEVDLLLDLADLSAARTILNDRVDLVATPDRPANQPARDRERDRNHGNSARLTVRVESREDIPALVELTASIGLPIYGIVPREKTLRDVYLSLYIDDDFEGGSRGRGDRGDTHGKDTRRDDPHGKETRGSNTERSDTRRDDTQGSDTEGSDTERSNTERSDTPGDDTHGGDAEHNDTGRDDTHSDHIHRDETPGGPTHLDLALRHEHSRPAGGDDKPRTIRPLDISNPDDHD